MPGMDLGPIGQGHQPFQTSLHGSGIRRGEINSPDGAREQGVSGKKNSVHRIMQRHRPRTVSRKVQHVPVTSQEIETITVLESHVGLGGDAWPGRHSREVEHRVPVPLGLDGVDPDRHRPEPLDQMLDTTDVIVMTMRQQKPSRLQGELGDAIKQGLGFHAAIDQIAAPGIGSGWDGENETVGLHRSERHGDHIRGRGCAGHDHRVPLGGNHRVKSTSSLPARMIQTSWKTGHHGHPEDHRMSEGCRFWVR